MGDSLKLETIRELANALRMGPYTSLGSYPLFFTTEEHGGACEVYCYAYVRSHFRELATALRDGELLRLWHAINWESDLTCDGSGEPIERAYDGA